MLQQNLTSFENEETEEKKLLTEKSKTRDNSNVFHIYRSPEDFKNAGIFNGGLDIGVDPT